MSLQEVLAGVRLLSAPINEESAKFKIIAPILGALGWDMSGPEVLFEYSVGDNRAGGRVDVALKGSRGVVALIEAKAPGADLSGHVSQVLGYAFHEGTDICVLTTGMSWWLYLPREKGSPEERRFRVLDIADDPVEELADDLTAFLGKPALESGDAISQASRVLQAQRQSALLNAKIPSIWRKMVDEPDDELLELIIRRVYSEIGLRPSKEQVVAALRAQPVPTAPRRKGASQPEVHSTPARTSRQAPQSRDPVPTAIVFLGRRHPVSSHKDLLVTVTQALYEEDPNRFPELLELKGKKYPYVSKTPQGNRPHPVGTSGYFVDTNLPAERIWKRAQLFLNHLRYQDSDLTRHYD